MGKQTCANNILMHALRIMVALLCIALTRVCEAISVMVWSWFGWHYWRCGRSLSRRQNCVSRQYCYYVFFWLCLCGGFIRDIWVSSSFRHFHGKTYIKMISEASFVTFRYRAFLDTFSWSNPYKNWHRKLHSWHLCIERVVVTKLS